MDDDEVQKASSSHATSPGAATEAEETQDEETEPPSSHATSPEMENVNSAINDLNVHTSDSEGAIDIDEDDEA